MELRGLSSRCRIAGPEMETARVAVFDTFDYVTRWRTGVVAKKKKLNCRYTIEFKILRYIVVSYINLVSSL